jgi:hypothetical protein
LTEFIFSFNFWKTAKPNWGFLHIKTQKIKGVVMAFSIECAAQGCFQSMPGFFTFGVTKKVRMKTKRRKRNKALQTKTTGKEQIIKIKGKRAALRSACMDFCGASMQLQLLHNLKANPNH